MILVCRKTVTAFKDDKLFTSGCTYEFVPVNNRYTKINGFVGYIKKDDEGYKRWLTEDFKKEHFAEFKELGSEIPIDILID